MTSVPDSRLTTRLLKLPFKTIFLLALLNVVTLSSLNPFMQLIIQGAVMLVAVSVFQFLKKSPAN